MAHGYGMHPRHISTLTLSAVFLAVALLTPTTADAFCGFYASGAGAEAFNNATQVVLTRYNGKTAVTMQNNYIGDPAEFAMVIPVPQVLEADDVRVVSPAVFKTIDTLTAPRLVEYWDVDPCADTDTPQFGQGGGTAAAPAQPAQPTFSVNTEAKFEAGEYDVELLSAEDSSDLIGWLKSHGIEAPDKAHDAINDYIADGMYFLVARIDPNRVTFDGDRAVLSPLQFRYTSDTFKLPTRLGLANANGSQDLVVYTLGKRRYEASNRPNTTIPTNFEVTANTKAEFDIFYSALFERMVQEEPDSVVTEYVWGSNKCDPCPGPTIGPGDMFSLGVDTIGGDPNGTDWVITRLHSRYSATSAGEDLILSGAPHIRGGNEGLGQGAEESFGGSTFQARYSIRHKESGTLQCAAYHQAMAGVDGSALNVSLSPNSANRDLSYYEDTGGMLLEYYVMENVPEANLFSKAQFQQWGCATAPLESPVDGRLAGVLAALALGFVALRIRRR